MKKRSLVAALAMLMVSAIVLTSSTYAWFATSTKAQVKGINATIVNAEGSIKISNTTGEDAVWSTTLDVAAFKPTGLADDPNAANSIVSALNPVSFDVTNGAFVAGGIAQSLVKTTNAEGDTVESNALVYSPSNETAGNYMKMNIYVKSETAQTVKVTLNGTLGYDFIFAALEVGGERTVYSTQGDAYLPVKNSSQKVIDVAPEDSIVTTKDILVANDGTYTETNKVGDTVLGNEVTSNKLNPQDATQKKYVELNLAANAPQLVTLYVWAEGNHPACCDTVDGGFGLTVDFVAVPQQTN